MRAFTIVAVLVALVCVLPASVEAWNCYGHMMVAEIAMSKLSAAAQTHFGHVAEYIGERYLRVGQVVEQACWPDDLKTTTKRYSEWHYINQCYVPSSSKYPCPKGPTGGDLAMGLTHAFHNSFKNRTENPADYNFWFSFLVHLVGDAHQPLHTCTLYSKKFPKSDNGGNLFTIKYKNTEEALHEFCDSVGQQFTEDHRPFSLHHTFAEHVKANAMTIAKDHKVSSATAKQLSLLTWFREGLEACGDIYDHGKLKPNSTLTESYITKARSTLDSRIAVAGARLGTMMEHIYKGEKHIVAKMLEGLDVSVLPEDLSNH